MDLITTMAIVRWMDLATSRLARPKAAYTRILTPILILPFALSCYTRHLRFALLTAGKQAC